MLFLDTEFNGHGGQLISLALVSDIDGHEFYGVLPLPKKVNPWVREHVVPWLNREAETEQVFRARLAVFMRRHEGEDIVADWPEDFVHLLNMITMSNGHRVNVDFTMHLVSDMDTKPEVPHNALSDAKALMWAWKSKASRRFEVVP